MEKHVSQLQELSILKMPGLPKGLPVYRSLRPHINIVYGRNGSGKSSTARAIRDLIWGSATAEIQAETTVMIGADRWDLKLDGRRMLVQRNGINEPLPGRPATEVSDRYILALHELVIKNDEGLATEIIKESMGGYDLDAASRQLGYAPGANTKGVGPYREWDNASREYERIKREQEGVKYEEERLPALMKAREEGEEAGQLKVWYEKLLAWLETKGELAQATVEVDTFPPIMEFVSGEEYTAIGELEKERDRANGLVAEADKTSNSNLTLKFGLGLPAEGLAGTVLLEMEERIALLENSERDASAKQMSLEVAITTERNKLTQIGMGNAPEDWEGIVPGDVGVLDRLLQQEHMTLSAQQALESLIEIVKRDTREQAPANVEQLTAGILVLSSWLQEPVGDAAPQWPIWLLIAAGYIAAAFAGRYPFMLVVGLALLVLAFWLAGRKKTGKADARILDYGKLELPRPAVWDRPAVIRSMEELVREWKNSIWQKEQQTRLELYAEETRRLTPMFDELRQQRMRLEERLKVLPDGPFRSNLKRFDALYWFLKCVDEWLLAREDKRALAKELEVLVMQGKQQLELINGLLLACNSPAAVDGPSARALLVQLKEKDKAWQTARTAIAHAEENRKKALDQLALVEEKLSKVYSKLAIPEGDKEAVRRMVGRLTAYQQARREKDVYSRLLTEKLAELQLHSRYPLLSGEVENAHPDEVGQKLKELAGQLERLELVKKEIYEINLKVNDRKKGSNLEAALVKKEETLESLADLYSTNLANITGTLLVDILKKQTGEENQPAVFRRAKRIFGQITAGRYELIEPTSDTGPLFQAYDTILHRGQPLTELSTGTRVQLLLAVRLAFIEEQEQGLRLPVLADELLATTDEERAKAVIEALVEIGKEGRQVFYFTAQKEEVYKWKSYLDGRPEVSLGLFELDGGTNDVRELSLPVPDATAFAFPSDIPEPMGLTHADYGRALHVERFDLLRDKVGALHLWYLVDDPIALAGLLRRGIHYWGQLATFVAHNGKLPDGVGELLSGIRARVGLLERFQELYRQGRPLPIDRRVLEDSRAISGRFMDEVSDRLAELSGNPRELLGLLRNKGIEKFRVASADELEKYLLEKGYIGEEEPMTQEEMLLRLQAYLSQQELELAAAQDFLARVI